LGGWWPEVLTVARASEAVTIEDARRRRAMEAEQQARRPAR
jgi:hypothetical protein